jgi:peroxiredoxin
MKKLKALLLFPGLLVANNLIAQTNEHLILSNANPEAGKKINITYDPTGTVTDGKKEITGVVYFLDNKLYPAADIAFKNDGKLLKGEIAIPENTKAFFVKIASDGAIDNNNEAGYVYLIYKDKQPVSGAYAMKGYMLSSGMGAALAKIKTNLIEGLASYKQELALHPETEKEYQNLYYSMLTRSSDSKDIVAKKITSLKNSTDEKDLMLAVTLLKATKDVKGADSLTAAIKTKFPDGTLIRSEMEGGVYREKDPVKKEELYKAYVAKYPENTSEKNTPQENYRAQLAAAFLQKGDMENYAKYESQIKEKGSLAVLLNNIAYEWATQGQHLDQADKMSKESLDIIAAKISDPQPAMFAPPSQVKKSNQATYDRYADTYAYILFKENKFDEALKYQQAVVDNGHKDTEAMEHYLQILDALGKADKVKSVAEECVATGVSSITIKDLLKKNYVKVKGSDTGYDQYLAGLTDISKNKAKAELAKTMINKPAPDFALKDLDGKTVALKDLKGKTVIVDFWATWCGPCKASFPGMQIAVNKYKDDPNVKFLFVDTWESIEDFVPGVKKFIADNNYSFHVLLDEKNEAGKQAKVVSAFDVSGIPTKFIIDKNGNIRFKYVGYSGSTDKVVEEVTNMLELASNADTETVKASTKPVAKEKSK